MLLRTSLLQDTPVMSLQTGEQIATTSKVMVSPVTLKIVGFELSGRRLLTNPSFLRTEDIRELSNIGFIVDSSDECVGLDDVIAIKELYNLDFELSGMPVVDRSGKKIGRIYDTVFATETFTVEQLCINKPFLQSFGDAELLIHRNQIYEINRDAVIIRNQKQTAQQKGKVGLTNPFRQEPQAQPPAADAIDTN